MTKNLHTLCCLLIKTDIDYTVISDNEISIEAMALRLIGAKDNPKIIQTAGNPMEEDTLWEGESYLHITEEKDGSFSLVSLRTEEMGAD